MLSTAGMAATVALGGCLVGHQGTEPVEGPPAELLPTADDLRGDWREVTPPGTPPYRRQFQGGPNEAFLDIRARVYEDVPAASTFHDETVARLSGPDTLGRTDTTGVGDEAVLYHPISGWILVQFRERNAVGRIVLDEHPSRAAALDHARWFQGRF